VTEVTMPDGDLFRPVALEVYPVFLWWWTLTRSVPGSTLNQPDVWFEVTEGVVTGWYLPAWGWTWLDLDDDGGERGEGGPGAVAGAWNLHRHDVAVAGTWLEVSL
jgi:hypothetical protein